MDLDRVKKKLREAAFFLGKMQEEERDRLGPKEPFEFYLSAFLAASQSVVDVLKSAINREPPENRPKYNDCYRAWKDRLGANKRFVECMASERNAEVHRGAGPQVKIEQRVFPNVQAEQLTGGFVLMGAPHGVSLGTYDVNRYYLTIDGTSQLALEACTRYLQFQERLITEFEAAPP